MYTHTLRKYMCKRVCTYILTDIHPYIDVYIHTHTIIHTSPAPQNQLYFIHGHIHTYIYT